MTELFHPYNSVEHYLPYFRSPLNLWGNCLGFPAILKHWYFITLVCSLFLKTFSCFLILCLAFGSNCSLFPCNRIYKKLHTYLNFCICFIFTFCLHICRQFRIEQPPSNCRFEITVEKACCLMSDFFSTHIAVFCFFFSHVLESIQN